MFKLLLVRCLNSAHHKKVDFMKKLHFKGIRLPVKIRGIHKLEGKMYQHQRFWLSQIEKSVRKISNLRFKKYF